MNRKIIDFIIIIVVVLLLAMLVYLFQPEQEDHDTIPISGEIIDIQDNISEKANEGNVPKTNIVIPDELEEALVTRVIDGDTVVLENNERVRFLGIDTPERGQYFYQESKEWLIDRIEGKKVGLESGREDRDKYDRLLRYIYIDNELVNIELIEHGFATAYIFNEDGYSESILEAEAEAREKDLGIWAIDIDNAFCVGIHYFHYNAKGNDNENLNDEYVTFRNKCFYPVNLENWILKDEAKKTYVFPEFILMNKSTATVYTGSGKDNETYLYWGSSRAIWNNAGDSLYLWDAESNLILNYSY